MLVLGSRQKRQVRLQLPASGHVGHSSGPHRPPAAAWRHQSPARASPHVAAEGGGVALAVVLVLVLLVPVPAAGVQKPQVRSQPLACGHVGHSWALQSPAACAGAHQSLGRASAQLAAAEAVVLIVVVGEAQ